MNLTLRAIQKPLIEELKQYDLVFKQVMSSNIGLIDTVVKYVVKHKGKNLRPLLVLLSAKLTGRITDNTYTVATIVEMLHSATLIHDDVVDEADLRRGFPSINAQWKNKIAVLMGDYLLSKCLIGGTQTGQLEVMSMLADASKRLTKGEFLQIEKSKTLNINEEEFIEMISNKTAALIGAAAELGALTAEGTTIEDQNNMRTFGESLGIAFQLHDDLLDYYGNQKIVGKPIGNDFKDKKLTLPLIHAFQNAEKSEIKKIKKKIRKGVAKKDIKEIILFAEEYGGIAYAQEKQNFYADKAKSILKSYPESDVNKALQKFVDYVIKRAM